MTTFADLVNEVALILEGYGLNQGRAAFLSTAVDTDDLSFLVDSTMNIEQGVAEIGDELVYIQSIDDASRSVTISPDGRGYRGSLAADHAINTRLTMNPIFPRTLVRRKINETIVGTYPTLQAESVTEFQVSPVVYGYEMPVGTEDVVSVRFDVVGPSQTVLPARFWKLDRHADPDIFASGVSLMLWDFIEPGRTARVVYRHQPTELANDTDLLTASGLSDSARAAVIWGTAWRLVQYMDIARLPVSSAQSDVVDEQNPIGRATDIATTLFQQYARELSDEQRRSQLRTPPTIHYEDF